MSYAKERDEFMAVWRDNGGKRDDARVLMRLAATQDRLAVASCNGDWPADNGERETKTCPKCQMGWAPESFRKGVCPDCRIEQRIREFVKRCGFNVKLGGDPRGYTTKVLFPNGRHNTWGGSEDGWGVPVRGC